MTNFYHCNKCGIPMEFQERKYVFVEVAGEDQEYLGIHVCPSCKPEVVDFINTPPELPADKQRRDKFGRFHK